VAPFTSPANIESTRKPPLSGASQPSSAESIYRERSNLLLLSLVRSVCRFSRDRRGGKIRIVLNLLSLDREGAYRHKIHKMLSFGSLGVEDVPDPYYDGEAGFEHVMDLLEDACAGLLQHLEHEGKL
jgi:hypothetical protein